MKTLRALALLALLPAGGCWPAHPEAPEEAALERYDAAEDLFKAGRYADAAPEYEAVIHARSRWKDAYVKLSRCHEALGNRNEAIVTLQRLLGIDRSDEDALRGIARLEAGKP